MPFSFDFGGFDPSAFGGFSGGDASQPSVPSGSGSPQGHWQRLHADAHQSGVTLLFGLGYFYFELPALNFHAEEFYVLSFCCARCTACAPCSPPASRGRASRATSAL